jgi:DNA-directed DNA polymerase III PolC
MRKFKNYIPLHLHSTYSIGDGVSKIEDIIKRAKEIGSNSIAISEHGTMASFYKFYLTAKSNNINPIIGCEFYVNDLYFSDNEKFLKIKRTKSSSSDDLEGDEDNYDKTDAANSHLIVYAKNFEGLQNIIHLNNIAAQNFYRKPLISTDHVFNILDENNIVTTACLASKFNKLILKNELNEAVDLLKKYKNKFKDDFYIEYHINDLKEQLKVNKFYEVVSKKLKIPLVLGIDAHYVYKEDWKIQYLLYVIKTRNTVNTMPESKWFYTVRDLYIKTVDDIYDKAELLNYNIDAVNEAIASTFDIANKVNIEIPKYRNNFPKFFENYEDSVDTFNKKLEIKWDEKVKNGLIPNDKIEQYRERLEQERKLMIDKGYIDYFLILDDLLNNFVYKTGGSSGAGRGSASGSLILFILGVTKIDPLKYDLIFERFINEARTDPPDVDCDIDHITQKKVENYLIERWGHDKVCHVGSFGKFGTKTLIKDICRVYELDFNLSNQLTALFSTTKSDSDIRIELENAYNIAQKTNNYNLIDFIDKNKSLFIELCDKMTGMIRQQNRHASGVLISDKTFENSDLPIAYTKGSLITNVQEGGEDREVSELGYLKLDILGLITATINGETIKLVEKNYNIKNLENQLLLSNFDDVNVYKEFGIGNSKDIFQFGSDSMIELMKRIKPNSIQELTTINALFRPALVQNGSINEYIKNRENPNKAKKEYDKISKDIWPLFKETFGIPLYQESIMLILQKIGGFTLAEADKVRKTLKLFYKKYQDKSETFLNVIDKFKTQAINNGLSEEGTEVLLQKLATYTEYSFNKCLSGNTYVQTINGIKQISDFLGGEIVISVDPVTKKVYQTKVKKLHKNGIKKLYSIKTETDEIIECTLDHKFMIKSGKMKTLKQIIENNYKICIVGNKNVILNKDSLKEIGFEETFDLEIDDKNHNFVLSNGIVTSNSHAVAYAMNAYISQWLKIHYPKEYYATLLNYTNIDEISIFIKQATLQNVKIGSCTYGNSDNKFTVDYKNNIIRFGLNLVKGLRTNDIEKINNNSKIKDKVMLIKFIIDSKLNKKTVEVLSRLGYFSNIISNNNLFTEKLLLKLKNSKNFDLELNAYLKYEPKFANYQKYETLQFEKEYLGFYLSEHPFGEFYNKLLQKNIAKNYIRPKDLNEISNKKQGINLVALLGDIILLKSKKTGKEYYRLVLEDDETQINVTIFDAELIKNLNKGDFINIIINKDIFGYSAIKNKQIKIFNNDNEIDFKNKIIDFETINVQQRTKRLF